MRRIRRSRSNTPSDHPPERGCHSISWKLSPVDRNAAEQVGLPARCNVRLLRHKEKEPVDCSTSSSSYLARPEGFEPPTPKFVAWCSIQLSYGRVRSEIMEGVFCSVKPAGVSNSMPSGWAEHPSRLPRKARNAGLSIRRGPCGPLRWQLAEREGFEPSIRLLTLYSLSRGAPSASRASLRIRWLGLPSKTSPQSEQL